MSTPLTTQRALVIGEALIDIVQHGSRANAHVGGSPLNVAVGLARLGIDVEFGTEFAGDEHGTMIEDRLARAHVRVTKTSASDRPTSTAVARIGVDGSPTYAFELTWNFDIPPQTEGFAVVHVGSIGALRPPGAWAVIDLVEALPPEILVSFDPNIRPALLPSQEQTRALVERFAARADVVKLSDEDAEWLYPDDPSAAPRRLLACGASLVAVTRGSAWSEIHAKSRTVIVPTYRTTVVDTIGAGDSYMSGMIAAIVRGGLTTRVFDGTLGEEELRTIGSFAAAAAGLTVSRAGAVPPTEEELAEVIDIDWSEARAR
jgi:fructokinase